MKISIARLKEIIMEEVAKAAAAEEDQDLQEFVSPEFQDALIQRKKERKEEEEKKCGQMQPDEKRECIAQLKQQRIDKNRPTKRSGANFEESLNIEIVDDE